MRFEGTELSDEATAESIVGFFASIGEGIYFQAVVQRHEDESSEDEGSDESSEDER